MMNLAVQPAFDAEAYLAWEERQVEKHEFIAGEVFARAEARHEHVVVSGNLAAAFKQRLRGGPCQAYVADFKVRVEAADAFFYLDVVVSCDPRDHAADQFIAYPALIVEVLSESTAAFDRGKKFAAYGTLAVGVKEVVASAMRRCLSCSPPEKLSRNPSPSGRGAGVREVFQ